MKLKHLTSLILLSMGSVVCGQTTYEQEDLVYTLYEDHAEVTGHSETLPLSISIPSMVIYNDVEYPVTTIGPRVFFNSNIESVILPSSLTTIGEFAFASCYFKTIDIPASVTDIGICAFRGCNRVPSIEIPASVSHIGGGAFTRCHPVTVHKDNLYYTVIDGVLFSKDMTTILSYPENGPRSYTIPSTVTKIDDWTFFDCYLRDIVIPESVTEIGESVFIWSKFTHVEIPSSVTSIGSGAFEWCMDLQSIEIPSSVTSIGSEAFRYCDALEKASIPSSVTYMGKSVFEKCEVLEEVVFNAEIPTIEYGLFRECKSLKSITIPQTVTSIGKSSFLECESLTSVSIPPSVTKIADYAFSKCSSLTTLELSPNLKTIQSDAFSNCEALKDVIYLTKLPIYCNKNIFSDATYEQATLTLAAGGVAEVGYKVPWKYFANIKEDGQTGVSSVNSGEFSETAVFAIDGKFVSNSVENLNPGLYIVRHNNKVSKILIK